MQQNRLLTLDQFRVAHGAGAFSAARIVANGREFYICAESRSGDAAVLVRNTDKRPRLFSDPATALKLLHKVGFAQVTAELSQWMPAQASLLAGKGTKQKQTRFTEER